MKSKLTLLIFLLGCLNTLSSQTIITGLISENKTFTQADNPIRIQNAAVQQGAILRFEGACQVTIVDKLELAGAFQMVGNQVAYALLTGGIRYSGNATNIDLSYVQLKNADISTYSNMHLQHCEIISSNIDYSSIDGHQTIEQCVFRRSQFKAADGHNDGHLTLKNNTFFDSRVGFSCNTLVESNQFVETGGGEAVNGFRSWSKKIEVVGNSFKGYKNVALHLGFERERANMTLLYNVFENNGTHLTIEYDANDDIAPKLTTEGNQFLKYKQYAIKLQASSSNRAKPALPFKIAGTFGDKKTPQELGKAIYDFDDDFHLRLKIQVDTTNSVGNYTPSVSATSEPQNAREQVIEDAKRQVAEAQQNAGITVITAKPKPLSMFFKNIGYAFGDLPISLKFIVFSWFWVFFEKRGWGFLQKIPVPHLYSSLLKQIFTILLLIGSLWVFTFTFGFNPRFSDTLGQIPFGLWFPILMAGFMFIVFKLTISKSSIDWSEARKKAESTSSTSSSNSSKKETIKKAIKNELIEIIEWTDNSKDTVVWKFPTKDNTIKNGAKLIVRESQIAILVNEGLFGDHYLSGTYSLTTSNMPILTTLGNWMYGFKSPFKIDIYYISTRQFVNIGWQTEKPFIIKDIEFGTIRLKASGKFALRVTDAQRFLTEFHGTKSEMLIEEVVAQLKTAIATKFADTLAESKISVSDLAANYLELGERLLPLLKDDFADYGLEITRFYLEHITLPPDVEARLDKN